MPDVLTLKAPHFEVTVWAKDVAKPQMQLAKTHAVRGVSLPTSMLRFNPALMVGSVTPPGPALLAARPLSELALQEPLFFENKQYEFEFLFGDVVNLSDEPTIIHRLQSIEEGFHYKGGSLRGSINFGNDVGWFRLGVRYRVGEQEFRQYISFEVLPTKMAMTSDMKGIHQAVDEFYPLWRFSFVQKTEQELAKSRKPHERFELLWLAHFQSLRKDLEKGIQRICRAPHTRLLPNESHVRAERLRGRLTPKLEELVAVHLCNDEGHHHYRITGKRLSLDTPENQFVKMVLTRSTQDITRFIKRARQLNQSPEKARISESFFSELEGWKRPLDQLLNRPFFAEVGPFEGLASESLVLHQRAGYSAVYRIWQELKLYLDVFGHNVSISMKSVAELYEVWCLLEVRRMLFGLGFTETANSRASLNTKGLEKNLTDGLGAAFHLKREDGIKIRLAHEPLFSPAKAPTFGKIYSWPTAQQPDIFLEAIFLNGEKIHWIFDAKYRIAEDKNGIDWAPDDAINQMHRYRDALIYVHKADDGEQEKRRPILGAFVLFPGWLDETVDENPYGDAIEAVGIGGFPLLPGRPNKWLQDFLTARFGNSNVPHTIPELDHFLVEDSARIAPLGTSIERYDDLTLAAQLGTVAGVDEQYKQRFLNGTAGWYHVPLKATDKKSIVRNAMREVRYCAIAVPHMGQGEIIIYLYEVKSVCLVKLCDLTIAQAGKLDGDNSAESWLFELGFSRPLPHPLGLPGKTFRFQLTNAAKLLAAKSWAELPKCYALMK